MVVEAILQKKKRFDFPTSSKKKGNLFFYFFNFFHFCVVDFFFVFLLFVFPFRGVLVLGSQKRVVGM